MWRALPPTLLNSGNSDVQPEEARPTTSRATASVASPEAATCEASRLCPDAKHQTNPCSESSSAASAAPASCAA